MSRTTAQDPAEYLASEVVKNRWKNNGMPEGRAESQRERDALQWTVKTPCQLSPGVAVVWRGPIPGLFTSHSSTAFGSLPKVGKTTFLTWLTSQFDADGLKVLIISEEAEKHWKLRHEKYGFSESIGFLCRPFKTRPSRPEWEAFISFVATLGFDVVVFDTLPNLWSCTEENSSDHAITTLMPLTQITEAGAALILTGHTGKVERSEGMAWRGSNAIPGWVDTVIEMRRTNADEREDGLRTIKGWGRYDETPAEVVVELCADGYRVLGEARDVKRAKRLAVIADILDRRGDDSWLSITGVEGEWPEAAKKPSARQLHDDLADGWKKDLWRRQGKGVRNDPLLYSCNVSFASKPIPANPDCLLHPLDKGCCNKQSTGILAGSNILAETSLHETVGGDE